MGNDKAIPRRRVDVPALADMMVPRHIVRIDSDDRGRAGSRCCARWRAFAPGLRQEARFILVLADTEFDHNGMLGVSVENRHVGSGENTNVFIIRRGH